MLNREYGENSDSESSEASRHSQSRATTQQLINPFMCVSVTGPPWRFWYVHVNEEKGKGRVYLVNCNLGYFPHNQVIVAQRLLRCEWRTQNGRVRLPPVGAGLLHNVYGWRWCSREQPMCRHRMTAHGTQEYQVGIRGERSRSSRATPAYLASQAETRD